VSQVRARPWARERSAGRASGPAAQRCDTSAAREAGDPENPSPRPEAPLAEGTLASQGSRLFFPGDLWKKPAWKQWFTTDGAGKQEAKENATALGLGKREGSRS
jgi:hypothetical protein